MTKPATILDWLTGQFPTASKTTLRDMVERKRVRLNGVPVKSLKQPLLPSDRVEVGDILGPLKTLAHGLRIVYQDSDIVVVDKPAGLLTSTHPDETRPTAMAILEGYFTSGNQKARLLLIHRLDRDASGLLVFARSRDAFDKLKDLFETHDLARRYVAIVHGRMKKPKGTFSHILFEDEEGMVRPTSNRHKGKPAVLHYEVQEAGPERSRVLCTLETGRKHQIRAQMKIMGHPICGDPLYGSEAAARGQEPPGRLALHATHLSFAHPRTGKPMGFDSPAPAEWSRLVQHETRSKKQEAGSKKGGEPARVREGTRR